MKLLVVVILMSMMLVGCATTKPTTDTNVYAEPPRVVENNDIPVEDVVVFVGQIIYVGVLIIAYGAGF